MWTNAQDEINRTSHDCAMKSYYDRNLFVVKKYVFDRFKLRATQWISNWCELITRDKMFIITREGGENMHVFTRAYKSNQRQRVLAHVITPQPNKTTTTHQLVKCAMDSLVYRPSSCSIDWFVMQLRVSLKRRRSNKWCDNVFFWLHRYQRAFYPPSILTHFLIKGLDPKYFAIIRDVRLKAQR